MSDKFLESQTFKTGTFVLLVLFILIMVFKLGVIHGNKKVTYPHKYGNNYSQIHGGTFSSHFKGMSTEDVHKKILFMKKVITDEGSEAEELAQ